MKLKRVILADLIFILIIAFLAALSVFSYQRINDLNNKANWLTHTNLVKLRLEQILSYVKDAETGQRGFLLTNDSTHLTPYLEAFEKQQQVLKEIDSLVQDNPAQQSNAKILRFTITERLNKLSTVIKTANIGTPEMKQTLLEGKNLMNKVRALTSQMIHIEDDLLIKRIEQRNYAAAITPFYSLLLSVFAILAVALTYFIFRSETRLRFHAEDSIKKLNEYFKDLPAAFSIVKGPGHIHEMSNTLYNEITGNRQLIGKSIREAFPELKGQGLYEILDKVYTSGKPYIGREMPLQFNTGLKRQNNTYYNFIYQPIFSKSNQPEGILIFGYEISEMIEARTKLEEEEQRTRLAIEAANIGTFDWDIENKVFISSTRLMEIFGFKGRENVTTHQDLINTFHPEDRPLRNKAVEESYTKGSLMYEVRVIQPGGPVRWVSVYGKVIHSSARLPTRMYGTVIDITEQKVIMEELVRSEAQFRLLSDSMPQFVWTGDVTGKLNYFSKAVYDFTRLSQEELINDGWLSTVHPGDREKTTDQWMQAVATGREFIIEHRVKHHTGEYRWHLSRALPQKGNNGVIQRWVGTSTDIQGHKDISRRLEQQVNERTLELKELNKHLIIKNNIFAEAEENALIGTYSWHLKTGELEYSDNLFRLFGYEPGEFVPGVEKYLSLIHPDDIEQVKKDSEETMATKTLVGHTYRVITKQGKVKYFRSTGKFIGEDENAILIGTVQDISQDKIYNEILQAKNLELETSNTELESFNYIASHDLQEPLRKIQAFSQRIISNEENNLTAFTKDYFNRIQAAAARMQNLIDALLSYSHTHSYGTAAENIDLNMLVQDVVNELQDVTDEKDAVIKFKALPTLRIISIQVQQLFINLISNALKYSRDGVAPEINITSTITAGKDVPGTSINTSISYWKISVSDNGIGFEQQYEHKIFELFQRLHGSNDYIGTGIGLAICKKIMRNHQGAISAIGTPGSGATFNMYFPAIT